MADGISPNECPEQIQPLPDEGGKEERGDAKVNGATEEDVANTEQTAASGAVKKKKKKKKPKTPAVLGTELLTPDALQSAGMNLNNLRQLQNLQKGFELLQASDPKAPKTTEEALKKTYKFWDTQPVPKLGRFGLSSVSLISGELLVKCEHITFFRKSVTWKRQRLLKMKDF